MPTEGQVWIGGEEITDMSDDELTVLRRSHIGFIFQFFNLLPMLTARAERGAAAVDRRARSPSANGSTR